MSADSNRPVPAAVDGRPWTVAGSGALSGATDTRGASMFVPMADTPTARLIRNHEQMHARITPRVDPRAACKRHGVSFEALQWAEDYRVTRALSCRDLVPDDALTDAECDMLAANVGDNPRMAAGAVLSHYCASVGPLDRMLEALKRAGWSGDMLASIHNAVTDMLDGALAPLEPRRRGRGRRPRPMRDTLESARGFVKFTVPLARLFDAAFPPGGSGAETGPGRPGGEVDAIKGAAKWAPLTDVLALPMDRTVRPRRPIGRRYSDCGTVPTAMHRLPTDGAVFTTKRRAKGGTILCDASGSMNYDDSDIDRILQEAPAAKIAFYAGTGGRRPIGRIVIGADRGRAATVGAVQNALPGGENMVDGPALRWLARQPAPRVWVSDEEVGGVSDFGKGGLAHAECLAICRAAGIRIVPSIDALR